MQIFLALHAVMLILAALPWLGPYFDNAFSTQLYAISTFALKPSFIAALFSASLVLLLALSFWLWLIQGNQRALHRRAAHHVVVLIVAGLGALNAAIVNALYKLNPIVMGLALFCTISAAYVIYFLYHVLTDDGDPGSMRLWKVWCAAASGAIVVPACLQWRAIGDPYMAPHYTGLSLISFSLISGIEHVCLIIVAGTISRRQWRLYRSGHIKNHAG